VARVWSVALRGLRYETTVVANADDPLVTEVVTSTTQSAVFFGIESAERSAEVLEHASDVKACPRCGGKIQYETLYLGHLGHYSCSRCSFRRPAPAVQARDVRLNGVSGSEFRIMRGEESAEVDLGLPGLYNVYNAVGAAAMAAVLGLDLQSIASALGRVTAAFGRMERLEVDGLPVYLALAKNPAGLNEVLRTLLDSERPLHLLMMLNDRTADGLDVSWIWDADIEMLQGRVASAVFSGTRAEDMALRFKYAGVAAQDGAGIAAVLHDIPAALMEALKRTPADGPLFIVPTYTALLDVRSTLTRLGYVKPYWEE